MNEEIKSLLEEILMTLKQTNNLLEKMRNGHRHDEGIPVEVLANNLKKYYHWWAELPEDKLEQITGLSRDSKDFLHLCDQWWEKLSMDQKGALYQKHNQQKDFL